MPKSLCRNTPFPPPCRDRGGEPAATSAGCGRVGPGDGAGGRYVDPTGG
eukprot:CAMPEP_0173411258 /NCGR_PEP_ID=MMETSP1356-20130122/76521_1 /TAXON_ID=77927 ORGANISM="Hemiselmis virescens, Strain PCC157" /NCGR_SAMPLE_ID=MMETSP1356 /ASSEMBLY_ACC=CAM_ASM_000847 /LENGTH=48 /DNA_ID= /DNA_START= /DNA_END= /DNA_ORIENTATION=